MAGRIIYLEVDDEITSAAARIRTSEATRLAVVLPYGSRVATSRINFRLLSRDALTHEKRLSIVSGDPATRALAASAGLPVFSSVAEYEASVAGLEDEPGERARRRPAPSPAPRRLAGAAVRDRRRVRGIAAGGRRLRAAPASATPDRRAGRRGDAAAAVEAAGTPIEAAAATARSASSSRRRPSAQPRRRRHPSSARPSAARSRAPGRRQRRSQPSRRHGMRGPPATGVGGRSLGRGGIRTPWLIGAAILGLAILVAGVGAYLLLPSARVVVTPRPEPVGPIQVTVVADPNATAPDPVAGVVPAKVVSIPVAVDDTFPATGKRTELTKATGTVRFENRDPTSTNRIAAGSVVRTASGIRFRTNATLTVPRAELVGLTIFPARASVKVTAVDGGPEGNVEAGTIEIVPNDENGLFLKVTNPEATTGGNRQEFTRVTQADVDAAMAALNASLQAAFTEAMADPSLTAGGATVFPSTGTLGPTTPTVPPETLVGQEVATFALGLSATGTVVTANTAPVVGDRRDPAPGAGQARPPARAPARSGSTSATRSSSARPSASRSRHRPSRSRSSIPSA